MKKILTALIPLLLVLACNQGTNSKDAASASGLPPARETAVFFSDSTQKDIFRIEFTGAAPETSQLVFTIRNAAGEEIYRNQVAAKDLFANYDAELDLSKKKNQVVFLKDESDHFFDEENFLVPAVAEDEQPDANVPDKKFHAELKKSKLNGFKYRLGKESNLYIAWSAQQGKVMVYYRCC